MTDLRPLLCQALNNPDAQFREGQEDAILAALKPPYRALVVQATGWGKSMVYFIATKVLRDQGKGPTMVVSPLLSLMRDQLRAAERLGLKAAQYTGENKNAWEDVEADIRNGTTDLVLISPERLSNESFRQFIASSSLANVGLIVIDEAHCISEWGHDFRPDYQRLGELVSKLPPTTSVLATTATANNRVVADVQSQIGKSVTVLRGPLARKSLRLQVIDGKDAAERLAWLSDHLNDLPGSGIIYTLTVRDADRVAAWLQSRGHNVLPYHSQIGDTAERGSLRAGRENLLLRNEVKALVATVALGMGFDKPDLGFVIHYQSPGNLVAYYQQIGRAGRAIKDAVAILFVGNEDADIHEWFISNARPSEEMIQAVLAALADEPMSVPRLMAKMNYSMGDIDRVLKTLSVLTPGPVVKVGTAYQLTPIPYAPDLERLEGLKEGRRKERRRFEEFAETPRCLMMAVQEDLDDPEAKPCGRCANCTGQEIVASTVSPGAIQAALTFLNRSEYAIEPRRQWQKDALPSHGFSGKIGLELICATGLCLSEWGDPGVAAWVRHDKQHGQFRDDIVDAAVAAINRKGAAGKLKWVCAVPSLRTDGVTNFAQRLSAALNLPYVDAITKVRETEPQKAQRNSFHQSHNLDGAFRVHDVRPGVALLVDDMVDSGWTFTIVGALLRQAGAAAVAPLALSSTKSGITDD